jgi:murein DD-endopeptidase MepM/ murein hydrolase activator NlpD
MQRLLLGCGLLLAVALAPVARAVELEGTWYVLIHFQDSETNKPDAWRWDDRVWTFTRKGDRLEWTENPIVQFDDDSGRFEAMRGGRAARVIGAWEPSASQLSDIQDGLAVNSRGSKTKTLRAEAGGTKWTSGESGGADSAMVITYSENWSIDGLPDAPVFTRDDSMGGASAESMEGSTRYQTESVSPGGAEIKGSFDRDGTRSGRFRLIRTTAHGLTSASKDQQELQRKAGIRAVANSEEMRQLVRERVQEGLAASGATPSPAELEKLTDEAIAVATRTGSADEAASATTKQATELFYSFAPRAATHATDTRYLLPFDPSTPRRLGQGINGDMGYDLYGNAVSSPQADPITHTGRTKYGFDWGMPIGTTVVAARDGEVARVVDGSGGALINAVFIKHDDGTWGEYAGLDTDIPVQPGQKVKAGDAIGKARGSGSPRAVGVAIHFAVGHLDAEGKPESIPILFADGGEGFVPVPGSYYGAAGGKATKADPPPDEASAPKQ